MSKTKDLINRLEEMSPNDSTLPLAEAVWVPESDAHLTMLISLIKASDVGHPFKELVINNSDNRMHI